jgi:chemotaxis protein MotB
MKSKSQDNTWLISFADIMSLLACFFIVLFTTNNFEESRKAETESKINKVDPVEQSILSEIDHKLLKFADKEGIDVEKGDDFFAMVFKSESNFKLGSAKLSDSFKVSLDKLIDELSIYESLVKIDIEGHTDSKPIYGSLKKKYDSNWELSSARAISVLKYFTGLGFDTKNTRAIGYADTRPIEIEGKLSDKQSRRVRVVLYAKNINR